MTERDAPAVGLIDVRRHGDGSWTWRYRDGGGTEIVSNRVFRTLQGAVASARHAYPGVEIEGTVRERLRPRLRPPRPPGRLLVAAGIAGAVVGALAVRRRLRREVRIRRVGAG